MIYAGGIRPLNGFYLGLYGGSELPGILASDPVLNDRPLRNGYREIDRSSCCSWSWPVSARPSRGPSGSFAAK